MNILAIETSSLQGTLALQVRGEISQVELPEQKQQIVQILPLIDRLLGNHGLVPANLDLLAFSAGPGSFTGVRVALGIIQGLALATQLPAVSLSSLKILASTARRLQQYEKILCCVNAYMYEIYVGGYQVGIDGQLKSTFSERIVPVVEIPVLSAVDYYMVGDAWQVYDEVNEIKGITIDKNILFPQAYDMLNLAHSAYHAGDVMAAENISAYYLRGKSAWQKTS